MNHLRVYAMATCLASLSAAGCGGNAGLNGTLPGRASTGAQRQLPSGTFAEYPITAAHEPRVKPFAVGITNGPDGALWFTERGWGKLGRITTDGDITNQYSLRVKGEGPSFHPQNVVTGPDGDLWATCGTLRTYLHISHGVPDPYGSIRRMSPSGVITAQDVFHLPTKYSDPRSIVTGPDGNLWFTERRGAIGEIDQHGTILNEFATQDGNAPYPIAVGSDGNIWFGETFNRTLGQVTIPAHQRYYFTLPKHGGPAGIVAGPGGYLYATEFLAGKVAQIDTSGVVRAEALLPSGSCPKGITVGSDGNLYVAEFCTGNIARITLTGSTFNLGAVTEFPIPTSHSGPWGITSGPDENIWFAESLSGKIGELAI